jgi:predicted ATPase
MSERWLRPPVIDPVTERISSPTFVGRARELRVLDAGLQRARLGDPHTILVGGEAGVGKSRLIEEFHDGAEREGAWTLLGRCIPTRDGLAFAPVVEVLRRLSRAVEPAMFDHLIGGARHELARLVPELDRAYQPTPPVDMDLDWTRGRLFELILGFVGRLADESCVVLTIEDLQWSDRSTQDLLSFLVRELNDEAVLLVGTYRTDELRAGDPVESLLSSLLETGRAQRVGLGRFDRVETAEQIAAITGTSPSASLIDMIHERSEGNAFFTEELLAAATDEHLELPRTVSDTMRSRIALLSELAQDILRVAAVAGRQVDHRLLSAASAMPEPELTVALREAVDRHMLIPDIDSYSFRHALLREAIYRSLLPGERRGLHEAYARALTRWLDTAEVTDAAAMAEMAHHWRAAGDVEAGLAASFQAARAAMTSCAYAEAHFQFEQVIDLWPRVSNAPDVLYVTYVDLLCDTAEAANFRGEHDRAIHLMRSALDQIEPSASTRASLLYGRLGHYLWESGDLQQAFAMAEQAASIAPVAPPSAARARALTMLARTRLLTAG